MKYLALERESGNCSNIPKCVLDEEALKVWEFYGREKIREIYFTKDSNAVILLECTDEKEARDLLNELPLVKENFITFDVIRLFPYTGFLRLFSAIRQDYC